ncbi:hypothetical protein GA607_06715 [Bifidobacterium adolescentis]|nr:hypothetical protein GA606_08700 [Bifidobacterium adolescentis]KAB5917033.1 hypothetical protein GA608_07950 [Bifidobacterium adolescentis]KAB5921991.1 hypothetical protein GA607_06715 [Bifidobacterium adolescentis]KAB5925048.1 hypothetical protein GA605_06330 [Bifidobacterium adolescentis]KAB5927131.1 hypothetical protein GA611_06695 [Bifidobacterium adolescentis]
MPPDAECRPLAGPRPSQVPCGGQASSSQFQSCLISYNLVILPSWKEDGRITRQQFSAAVSLCECMPLYIKAGRSMDADCIAGTCRGLKQTSGLKLVVVDGLPSIVDHVDDEPRVLEQFSKLARDLDVAVVLTDLATRGPLRKPGLGNLINGKAECRYADAILFVYRPEFKCACGGDANKAELMVLKHPWIQPYTLNSVSSPNTRDSRITDLLRPDAQFW